mgnify:CR=1 FL=1
MNNIEYNKFILKPLNNIQKDTKAEMYICKETSIDYIRHSKIKNIKVVAFSNNRGSFIDSIYKYIFIDKIIESSIDLSSAGTGDLLVFGNYESIPIFIRVYVGKQSEQILSSDSLSGQFTIDSIYMDVSGLNNEAAIPVIDIARGIADLKRRVIRTINNPSWTIKTNPITLIRAIKFAIFDGFKVLDGLFERAPEEKDALNNISTKEFTDLFIEILLSDKPSLGIKLLGKSGLLDIFIPELSETYKVKQNSEHHLYDVFTHLILTCDAIEEKDLTLRLAALFHDIGKPQTLDIKKQSFHNHEVVGSSIVRKILIRLGFKKRVINDVGELVRNHMYCYTREWNDDTVLRFATKLGITKNNLNTLETLPLFKLRRADRIGNGLKSNTPITQKQLDFEHRIKELVQKK